MTKFSDVIGASHTAEYHFWEPGQPASQGLKEVAEHGSTRTLETELKSQSDQIRTIIKARGISYPNVTGKTFAVFRVDSKHHLISLVSMISPSPDWIVGVSMLELCRSNCSWLEDKVLNLYPYDAGNFSNIVYMAALSILIHYQEPIRDQHTSHRINQPIPRKPSVVSDPPPQTTLYPHSTIQKTRK
jgi:hypothetical protein